MAKIKLRGKSANGAVMLVDKDDLYILSFYKWNICKKKFANYATAYIPGSGHVGKRIYAHRLIMGAIKGQHIDHINGDGLDNRKKNLRISTNQQNHFNIHKKKRSSSRYKGVTWEKRRKVWVSQICIGGKHIYIGSFRLEKDAAVAYNEMAKKLFGDFVSINIL